MREEIRSFGEAAKRLVKEYFAELSREDDGNDDYEYTTYPDFGVEMTGRSVLFKTILRKHVLKRMRPDDRYTFVILGEEGSGSRVVMQTVFENAREAGKFERWGWARVGKGCERKDVLMSLITQVEADVDDALLVDATEDRLSEYLYKALENRSYMIALDGADDAELVEYLFTTSFPDESNGSVVLVTTESRGVAPSDVLYNHVHPDVYVDDLWLHLRGLLFFWESIPAELEVAGKQIAYNCRGRTLSIAKTLVLLSKLLSFYRNSTGWWSSGER